ncbi:MAG: hypothetical protein ACKVOP_05940 [Sphingomonadaceae bacterium]
MHRLIALLLFAIAALGLMVSPVGACQAAARAPVVAAPISDCHMADTQSSEQPATDPFAEACCDVMCASALVNASHQFTGSAHPALTTPPSVITLRTVAHSTVKPPPRSFV